MEHKTNNEEYFDSEDEKEDFHKLPKENSGISHSLGLDDIDEFLKSLENPKKNKTRCKICDKELKSFMHAKTHYTSMNHLKNSQQIKEKWIQSLALVSDGNESKREPKSYCKICNTIVSEEMFTNGHLDSETHKRYAEMFCAICDLRLPSKHELWHHETHSEEHGKAKKMKGYVSPENTPCHEPIAPCEYHFEKARNSLQNQEKETQETPMGSPIKSDSESDLQDYDEKCQNYYCPVCDIQYLPDQYYPHMNEFPHSTLEVLKNQFSPRIVQTFCAVTENKKDIFCLLCNITMKGPGDIKSHLNGVKHIKKLKGRFPELFDEDGKINGKKDMRSSSESLKQLNGFEIIASSRNADQFSCYLCKFEFKSKLELNAHSVSFPHAEMAKWKSEAVSLGVPYAEYWVQSKNALTCTLCDVQISSSSASKLHMNDLKHKTHLVEWCKEFATWKCGTVTEPKFFFCEVCDLRLPGTSEAECHYTSSTHIKRTELYCKTCRVSNSSEKMLLEHQMSNRHKEKIFKETVNKIEICQKNSKEPISPDLRNESLEFQIFRQVDKLVHTLYYSRTVPFDIALNYLKKINREVAQLHTQTYDTGQDLLQETSEAKNYHLENFISNSYSREDVLRVTIEDKVKPEETKVETIKQDQNRSTEIENCIPIPPFSRISHKAVKLQQTAEGTIERDILKEILTLVHIVNINKSEKVLQLLKKFNSDLDCGVLKFRGKDDGDISC